jgi:hypothetical protein
LWLWINYSLNQGDPLFRYAAVVGYYFSFPLQGPTGQAWQVPWGVNRLFPMGRKVADRLTIVEGNLRPVEYDEGPDTTAFGLLGNTKEDKYGKVNVEMVLVPYDPDFAQGMTIEAVKLFNNGRYVEMVMPANVAVESTLGSVLGEFLDSIVEMKFRKEFMNESLTYGYMLSIMLPLCCRWLEYPMLPKEVMDALTLLRKTRNDVAHSGKPAKQYQSTDYARMLAATIIACRYLFHVNKRVLELGAKNIAMRSKENEEWRHYLDWKKSQ